MNAAEMVMVVPSVFANPAGLTAIASPVSVEATAAPARDVVTAPGPGKYMPPATALLALPTTRKAATHLIIARNVPQERARGDVASTPTWSVQYDGAMDNPDPKPSTEPVKTDAPVSAG